MSDPGASREDPNRDQPSRLVLGSLRRSTVDRWVMVVTALAVVGILLWFVVTQPGTRWWAVGWLLAAALFGLGVYSRTWLEEADADRPGALVQRYLWKRGGRVPLTRGSSVLIAPRGASVALEARGPGGTVARVGVAVGGDHPRSRDPRELLALADAVKAPGVDGGARVAQVLRAHAGHVERGRAVEESPVFRAGRRA